MAWLYQRGAVWWVGYRLNGKQVLRSTGKTDRAEAEKVLADVQMMFTAHRRGSLTRELYEALTGDALPEQSLTAAIEEWITEAQASTAPKTAIKYRDVGRRFYSFFGANATAPLLSAIKSQQVRSYLVARRAHVSAATCNLERKTLSVFFTRAVKTGLIHGSPVAAIPPFKPGRDEAARRRPFTLDELRLLYSKAPDSFWRYMIVAGFYSGQRMGDLISLRWGSVDFEENMLRLTAAKTGRTLHIPIANPLRVILDQLRRTAGRPKPSDPIWPEEAQRYADTGAGWFSNAFYDEVLTPCGLVTPRHTKAATKGGRGVKRQAEGVSFHSLRHSFVTLLKATGGSQAVAKALAGHGSDVVSDLYTALPTDALAQAVDRLPPLLPDPPAPGVSG